MTNQTKVTLPKEVAEAVGGVIANLDAREYYDIAWIHENFMHHDHVEELSIWLCDHANIPKYFSALVNGYEVEQTPHDKLRKFYAGYLKKYEDDGGDFEDGVTVGVIVTLDNLGITVEGIND